MTIQPGQARLLECTVGGVPYVEADGRNNFHVQEMRIYEDHCKAYFTGQLVIEAHQNTWEGYLNKGADVTITFDSLDQMAAKPELTQRTSKYSLMRPNQDPMISYPRWLSQYH